MGMIARSVVQLALVEKKQLLFWPILKNKKAIKKAISEVDVLNFVPSQTPR